MSARSDTSDYVNWRAWPFIHRRLLLAARISIGHVNPGYAIFKASSTALGMQIAGPVE